MRGPFLAYGPKAAMPFLDARTKAHEDKLWALKIWVISGKCCFVTNPPGQNGLHMVGSYSMVAIHKRLANKS